MMKAARGDGTAPRLIERLGKVQLLILDDFGLYPLDSDQRRDLMEIVEERAQRRSTLVTSQLEVKVWHEAFGDPTLADAVLDRLVNNAYRLELEGRVDARRRLPAGARAVIALRADDRRAGARRPAVESAVAAGADGSAACA